MSAEHDEILTAMQKVAGNDPGGKNGGTNQTIYHFARLLVLLEQKASVNADKNRKLTRSVNILTWVIVALTAILLGIGLLQLIYARLSYNLNAAQYTPHATTQTSPSQ